MPVRIQNDAATSEKEKKKKKRRKKTVACIREMQVHKLWTKVCSQKGLTAMWVCPTDTKQAATKRQDFGEVILRVQ